MTNLPYFFLLLKKNVALWTLIATGSFSKIDTAHTEYTRIGPFALILKNYSLSKDDTFKEIWILSTPWETHIDFVTSSAKYVDSMKHYFGTSSISGFISGGYTINGTALNNSINALAPIDIGLNKKVHVFLVRTGEYEYKISLMLEAKNAMVLKDRFMDSLRKADSAKNGLRPLMDGMRANPKPFAARLLDSAMRTEMVDHRKLKDAESNRLLRRSIDILNKAIKVDSSYLDAYELKFGWEEELKSYDSLIATGKKLLKLGSYDNTQVTYRIGECYELTGRTDSAMIYYQAALALYDHEINKIDNKDGYYFHEMSNKALVLILLKREQEGRAIFKELMESPLIDKYSRQEYQGYLVAPRDRFLKDLKP